MIFRMTVEVKETPSTVSMTGLLMTGVAFHFLYGPVVAVAALVTSFVLSKLAGNPLRDQVPLEGRVVSDFAKPWQELGPEIFKAQVLFGVLFKLSGGSINQVAIQWIRRNMSTPIKTFLCYWRVA